MKKLLFFLSTIFILAGGQSAGALTIDLWSQFPNYQGENGLYAYGYSPETNTYRSIAKKPDANHTFLTPEQPFENPMIVKVNQPWIYMHPSSMPQCGTEYGTEDVNLAFLSPYNNLYNLTGSFWLKIDNLYPDSGYIQSYIKKNDTLLFSSYLNPGDVVNYNLTNIFLNYNDYLYFGVSSAGPDYSDWGHLQGRISTVQTPEPGTIMLLVSLASGLFGFAGLRKRLIK
ncbi:MAG: PEP-CTERM sorting domain-containing protein [bacterium]|nr:PEP-CTERM sorting domain-containing protein [bacterium]